MDYSARLKRLRQLLTLSSCDVVLVENPIDLFYLTGLELSAGKLLIGEQATLLIVDGRYIEKSSQQTLYPVSLLKDDTLKEFIINHHFLRLGIDKHHTTYHEFLLISKIAESIKSQSYELEIVPVESLVQTLRLIKDEDEIELLRQAARLGYAGYEYVVTLLQEGITEKELAFELEFFWKKRGATRLAFDSIIAFGPNSSMPHYHAGNTKLKKNMSVLIDIGVVLEHYHSDLTRVVFFGKPPPLIEEIYAIVDEAKECALSLCEPGTLIGELDHAAREWIASKGYNDFFTHSLGHGVGLEIHEPPKIRETGVYSTIPLQAGMVLTIEPGIYLPEIGGVRLEDTILITKNGYDNLTTVL